MYVCSVINVIIAKPTENNTFRAIERRIQSGTNEEIVRIIIKTQPSTNHQSLI